MRRMLFVLAAAAVAGCASRPEPVVSFPPVEHWQEIMVQTIPRGCWVDHNSGYVGWRRSRCGADVGAGAADGDQCDHGDALERGLGAEDGALWGAGAGADAF
jgi:hypothetical protein